MWQRDNVFSRYNKAKNNDNKEILYHQYKKLRNDLTTIMRDSKINYYKHYFEVKRREHLISGKDNIKPTNKTEITLLDSKGNSISYPIKIANCLHGYFVQVGSIIQNKFHLAKRVLQFI